MLFDQAGSQYSVLCRLRDLEGPSIIQLKTLTPYGRFRRSNAICYTRAVRCH